MTLIHVNLRCRPHNFVDSSISYCVLPHIFVQRNNHAADDINSCEFTVSAAGHIILCCMDFRIFWNFFMLQDKSLMLSDTINSCCLDTAFYAAHGRNGKDGRIFLCGQQHFLLCYSTYFCAEKQSCCRFTLIHVNLQQMLQATFIYAV